MISSPTIAITGANGFIGSNLVTYFHKRGWKVIALVRNPPVKNTEKGVIYREYDLSKLPSETLLEGVDYLVHAAYIAQDSSHSLAYQQNIDGTNRLIGLSRRSHVKKNIFLSSLAAKSTAISIYGRQKYDLEKIFSTTKDSIVRPGLVIGKGGIVEEMMEFMKKKHIVPLVTNVGTPLLQVVDIPTLSTAIRTIIEEDFSGIFTVASQKGYSYKEFYQLLAKAINVRIIFLPIPYRLLLFMMYSLKKLGISTPVTEDSLLGLKNMTLLSTNKDLSKLNLLLPDLNTILKREVSRS